MVTDGEPTAHSDSDGEAFFDWPPRPETIRATVEEVDPLTRAGATINLIMLGEDEGLRRFVDAIARRNGGRIFSPDPARLGAFVVANYIRAHRRRLIQAGQARHCGREALCAVGATVAHAPDVSVTWPR